MHTRTSWVQDSHLQPRKEPSLTALRRNQPCPYLNFRLPASRTVNSSFSVLPATQFVVFCEGIPSKLTQQLMKNSFRHLVARSCSSYIPVQRLCYDMWVCLSCLLCCDKPSQHLVASDTYNNMNLSLLMIPWVVWGWDGWLFFWPYLGPVLSSLHWELSCKSDAKGSKHLISPGSLSTWWPHSSSLNIAGSLCFSYRGSFSRK